MNSSFTNKNTNPFTLEEFTEHTSSLAINAKNEKNEENAITFPVEIFPLKIQDIINATNESLSYPIDFIGASILYAASIVIGNSYHVELKKGYMQSAVIYLALVGKPGTNKSHPLTFAIQPIQKQDEKNYKIYLQQKKDYDEAISYAKKERNEKNIKDPIKPIWKKHLVADFTLEALFEVHKFNPNGIGVYNDELSGWFQNFNRYRNGSDEQFWLSNFNSKPVYIDRKNSEPLLISKPFISVGGTIQRGILDEFAKKNRTLNGFTDRILFVIPEGLKTPTWTENELSNTIIYNWEEIINKLMNLQSTMNEEIPIPEILQFSPKAKKAIFDFQKELAKEANESSDIKAGIITKLEMYTIRLSLILELLLFTCGESNKSNISIKAVKGSIKLIKFFKHHAFKASNIILNKNPYDKLDKQHQQIYDALPDKFKTFQGVEIAKENHMTERTFKNFINNKDLFERTKYGEYEKLL